MTTITRFTNERLIAQAEGNITMLRASLEHVKDPFEREDLAADLRLAEIALASLEAEPVGEVVLGEYDDCGCHPNARVACIAADGQADWENFKDGTRLYTAPPAPVVDAEPVAWTSEEALVEVYCGETGMIGPHYMVGNVPLYRHAQHAPVVPDEVNLAIENLKKKLVECNRYNYCSDSVKRIEDSFRAAMLNQGNNHG
ncbi:hypothetical protein KDV48_11875 [Citrobacter sedlakii]|uniref:hypothetical protein n=1 Tax=Citrobacter sedlakii TaxID=67826 RepID=UPI0033388B06|nr:hypothetical protein [Citrobacter sedlakii]